MSSIQFCPTCNNMFYVAINMSDDNEIPTLKYYCRNCGTEDLNVTNRVVLSKVNKNERHDFSAFVNKYTKLDPTLPRISGIKCRNEACPSINTSNTESSNGQEIILMRYDDANMLYLYLCPVCDHAWKCSDTTGISNTTALGIHAIEP